MIKLLCGSDNFRLMAALDKTKSGFDPVNIKVFANPANLQAIKSESSNLSFFNEEKLLIIRDLASNKDKKLQKECEEWLKGISSETSVAFVEEEELKNTNWLFSLATRAGKVETFIPLKNYEVSRWIKDAVNDRGGKIDAVAAEKLAQILGNDLWRLSNELDKLIAYDKTVTTETIAKLVEPEFLDSIFTLLDAISEKKEKKALVILNGFLKEEGNESYLISMLARQIRNLISVKELGEKGQKEAQIATALKLHPFVVKNTLKQSRNFTLPQLISFHQLLLETDLEIKSSSIDNKVLLFRLVHQFCTN